MCNDAYYYGGCWRKTKGIECNICKGDTTEQAEAATRVRVLNAAVERWRAAGRG